MAELIKDGTGKGFLLKVDSEHRALVHADMNTEEHNISHQFKRAYVMNTADTADTLTMADGESYNLLYLENRSSDFILNLVDIRVTTNTGGAVIKLMRNMVLGTATDNNINVPNNSNFSSEAPPSGVFHTWDETGTTGIGGLTGGSTFESHVMGVGSTVFLFASSVLLGNTNNIVVQITNNTGGSIEAAATVRFYYEEVS